MTQPTYYYDTQQTQYYSAPVNPPNSSLPPQGHLGPSQGNAGQDFNPIYDQTCVQLEQLILHGSRVQDQRYEQQLHQGQFVRNSSHYPGNGQNATWESSNGTLDVLRAELSECQNRVTILEAERDKLRKKLAAERRYIKKLKSNQSRFRNNSGNPVMEAIAARVIGDAFNQTIYKRR